MIGFQAVRHFYPRAATDAMITWMVTRLGFAAAVACLSASRPRATPLRRVGLSAERPQRLSQPTRGSRLKAIGGGHRDYVSRLLRMVFRSTSPTSPGARTTPSTLHWPTQSHDGRVPGRTPEVASTQRDGDIRNPRSDEREPSDSASEQITQQIGFDIEATQHLLAVDWNTRQEALLTAHFPDVHRRSRAARWRRVARHLVDGRRHVVYDAGNTARSIRAR